MWKLVRPSSNSSGGEPRTGLAVSRGAIEYQLQIADKGEDVSAGEELSVYAEVSPVRDLWEDQPLEGRRFRGSERGLF
jgi:hypothetical protein